MDHENNIRKSSPSIVEWLKLRSWLSSNKMMFEIKIEYEMDAWSNEKQYGMRNEISIEYKSSNAKKHLIWINYQNELSDANQSS